MCASTAEAARGKNPPDSRFKKELYTREKLMMPSSVTILVLCSAQDSAMFCCYILSVKTRMIHGIAEVRGLSLLFQARPMAPIGSSLEARYAG